MNDLLCDDCGEFLGYEIGSCPRNTILCKSCGDSQQENEDSEDEQTD